jgi:Glycosyl transferase family 2
MRLVGVAMVRNEADIVEAFVRHNMTVVDALTIVDHGSVDGTSEILSALAAEGLALTVRSDPELAQRQPEVLTRVARTAFAQGADIVFPLDADEFLKVPDRALLERVLAQLPSGLNAALSWQTYVPEHEGCPPRRPLLAARRRLSVERHGLHKVVLTRAFADDPGAALGPGSHTVVPTATGPVSMPLRLARLRADVAALAHMPVRSAEQITRKITVGWLAHRAAKRFDADLAFHWRELFEMFERTPLPSSSELRTIAANYGITRAHWLPVSDIALVEDPLPAGAPSRYDDLKFTDAGARVQAFAARLAQES